MKIWASKFKESPDRSTFYQWTASEIYSGNLLAYLRLCSCLDVDPLALLSPKMVEAKSFGDYLLMLAVQSKQDLRSKTDGQGRGIKISDIMNLFGPREKWPASNDVEIIFNRDWTRKFFANPGQKISKYETISIRYDARERPIIIHFAYRPSPGGMWRMYGSVEISGNQDRLIHLYGEARYRERPANDEFYVQTRFGEMPCEFCLASLHNFDFSLGKISISDNSFRFE